MAQRIPKSFMAEIYKADSKLNRLIEERDRYIEVVRDKRKIKNHAIDMIENRKMDVKKAEARLLRAKKELKEARDRRDKRQREVNFHKSILSQKRKHVVDRKKNLYTREKQRRIRDAYKELGLPVPKSLAGKILATPKSTRVALKKTNGKINRDLRRPMKGDNEVEGSVQTG